MRQEKRKFWICEGGKALYMRRWSYIRNKLENEYLACSLRGHIQYFVTSYSKCPDHEGRASILLDGKEIISGSYMEQWSKAHLLPRDETLKARLNNEFPFIDDTAIKYGQFDQRCFYRAFHEFDNQSIECSLTSTNMLVRIFAILDKRIGKRRLEKMSGLAAEEPDTFQLFYNIRCTYEGDMGKGYTE